MGKSNPFSFRRSSSTTRRRRTTKKVGGESPATTPPPSSPAAAANPQPKKKSGGARLGMRFDRSGESELFECDKNTIIKRAGIPRILGPVFSNSFNILAREKAMVVNLEHIKAIVTAEEVLLLDPLRHEVLPFVDQLRHQLSHKNTSGVRDTESNTTEGLQAELPFEFQVLEIALEVVCTYLDSNVADLERDAYPVLDELAKNVSTKNLERVRSLKSNLTRLLARVQKVRDELEHLLDDDEDMTQLYLTRKWLQNQQSEGNGSNSFPNNVQHLRRLSSVKSVKSGSMLTSGNLNDDDVEDLEMFLYFMQLDGTRNKILSGQPVNESQRMTWLMA